MKFIVAATIAATLTTQLCACSESTPTAQTFRPVKAVKLHYEDMSNTSSYFATVASRYEVDQAFRVGGKVLERRVDVGQSVAAGDILAVLDDVDYRLNQEAAQQRLSAATAAARQAESDWLRLEALKKEGSVSESLEEQAHSTLLTTRAAAEAEARQLELARNQVKYTRLHASTSGVITALHMEVGQVVAPGQAVISIANESEPEIIVDIPENNLTEFKNSHYKATLTSAANDSFDVVLRELSMQATPQTRTYRAKLKPATPRKLPLGASATLVAKHTSQNTQVATIPATALTQYQGFPAVWTVRPLGDGVTGTVELINIAVEDYRNDEILVSGPISGTLVVTAGIQKMAPGLQVSLSALEDKMLVGQEVTK